MTSPLQEQRAVRHGIIGAMTQENRPWWEERAALHATATSGMYDPTPVLAGRSTLREVERRLAGSVLNQRVIHLQCHLGFDTISWAVEGAREVVGLDFSAVAVQRAGDLAHRVGLADRVSFVVGDALDPPPMEPADLVVATYGCLCWIPDVAAWARAAAGCVAPGGRLVVVDLHPAYQLWETVDPAVADFPYGGGEAQVYESSGSYADPSAETAVSRTVQYAWSVAEILTALIDAGLVLDAVEEPMDAETDFRGDLLSRDDDGRYRLRIGGAQLPLLLAVRAVRPA